MPYYYDEDDEEEIAFKCKGSALRAATRTNPRVHPCPTCGRKNMLTKKDVALHYQCDYCADKAEMGIDGY